MDVSLSMTTGCLVHFTTLLTWPRRELAVQQGLNDNMTTMTLWFDLFFTQQPVHTDLCQQSVISFMDSSSLPAASSQQVFIDIKTPPRYRQSLHRAVTASCSLHISASCPLQLNVTSSTEPEAHNVVQLRERRIEPRPEGIWT